MTTLNLNTLNPQQRLAVKNIDSPTLVLAGAGSGKTRVITYKIVYLMRECGMKPANIAAVTFTNKAAREMKARVGQLVQGKEARGLAISTFHTLGLKVLQRNFAQAGLKKSFTILDSQDSLGLIRDIISKELGSDMDTAQLIQNKISNWKNAAILPEQANAAVEDKAGQIAASVYATYLRHLRTFNAVDFDDLIYLPLTMLRSNAEVLEYWQNKIRYLLVDEYQDTNDSQYQLIKLLMRERQTFTVVGDDDQSIYAWRGARPENLNILAQDFPRLNVIKLEQNYRSTGRILKAANSLIANNSHIFEKKLWSELGYGDPIRVIQCRDEEHEAERVVSEIISHRFKHRTACSDYAILYRGNHQSRLFERALREQRVPYFLSGGSSFFEKSEVKDVISYLRLLANPDDDSAFLRIVNTPRRELGPNTIEKLAIYAQERNCSLYAAIFEMGLELHLNERAVANLRRFGEFISRFSERAKRGDLIAAIKDMVDAVNYNQWLVDNCKDIKTAEKRMNNVVEVLAWAERVHAQSEEEKDLASIVAHMTLMDLLDRQEDDEVGDAVQLLTLHAAKGLEFPNVFVVGMEEEILPHRTSMMEDNFEEERRLAYVGITRAQKNLTFTIATRRKRYGEVIVCEPSRFLEELPKEDLEWEGARGAPANPEQQKARGQAHLANLKGLLAT